MYNGLLIPLYQQRWFRLQFGTKPLLREKSLAAQVSLGIRLSGICILKVIALAFLRICKPAANALVLQDKRTVLVEVNNSAEGAEVNNVGANAELCHVEAFLPLSLGGRYFLSVS